MRGQPKKAMIVLGVNSLARETGLPRQTVSERMRKGQTADQIRSYAALRQGLSPQARSGHRSNSRIPTSTKAQSEYERILRGRERMDALNEWKLRRAKALAEHQEIENMLRRGELIPVTYVRQWASRFLIDGRDELLKGPSELADALAVEDDPLKVQATIRAWLERAMTKWHQLERLWGDIADEGKIA